MSEELSVQETQTTEGLAQQNEGVVEKTYTEEDLAGLRSQWEKEMAEKLKEAKQAGMSEAERLAKLTSEEKLQEQLKALQEENESLRKTDAKNKLEAEALKSLETEKLPSSFLQLVMADNADAVKSNISALKDAFASAVQEEVEHRLKGKPPAAGGSAGSKAEAMQNTVRQIIEGGR